MKLYILFLGTFIFIGGCKAPKLAEVNQEFHLPTKWVADQSGDTLLLKPYELLAKDAQLVALIDSAIGHNFDLKLGFQRLEQVKASAIYSKGLLRPRIDIGVSSSLRRFGLYTMDGSGNATTEIRSGELVPTHLPDFFSGFQASWEIDIFGKLKNKNEATIKRVLASNEGLSWMKTNLIAEIGVNYYNLLAMDEQIALVDSFIHLQQQVLQLMEVQKEVGVINKLAIKQFEARLYELFSLKKELDQQVVEIENQLNFLVGQYSQKIPRNTKWLLNYSEDFKFSALQTTILYNRPDVKEAEYNLKANKLDLEVAKKLFYPSFNLASSVGWQAFRLDYLLLPQSFAYGILGGLVGPLVNKSAIKAEFFDANAKQLESVYAYQKIILQSYFEVASNLSLIDNLNEIYRHRLSVAGSLSEAIDASVDLFTSNRANYIEILLLQQSTLESKMELINLRKRQYLAGVQMYKILGGGWK